MFHGGWVTLMGMPASALGARGLRYCDCCLEIDREHGLLPRWRLGLHGYGIEGLSGLEFDKLGYGIVALVGVAWAGSFLAWRRSSRPTRSDAASSLRAPGSGSD